MFTYTAVLHNYCVSSCTLLHITSTKKVMVFCVRFACLSGILWINYRPDFHETNTLIIIKGASLCQRTHYLCNNLVLYTSYG